MLGSEQAQKNKQKLQSLPTIRENSVKHAKSNTNKMKVLLRFSKAYSDHFTGFLDKDHYFAIRLLRSIMAPDKVTLAWFISVV